MPALNFCNRFAPMVDAGTKRQTIRRERKRPIRIGDRLFLYQGMRTKACRKIGEAVCSGVQRIRVGLVLTILDGEGLSYNAELELAVADGFECVEDFRAWFERRYGLPFDGVVIHWGEIEHADQAARTSTRPAGTVGRNGR